MKKTPFNLALPFVLGIIFLTVAIILYINYGLITKFYMCALCAGITLICAFINLLK